MKLSLQPRILMAMARDGLLPSFFQDVSKSTKVPIKSTLVTGLLAGTLAFFMDVEQLSGMVISFLMKHLFHGFLAENLEFSNSYFFSLNSHVVLGFAILAQTTHNFGGSF